MTLRFGLALRVTTAGLALLLVVNLPGVGLLPEGLAAAMLRVAPALASTAAAGACLIAADRSKGRIRQGWLLFAVAAVGWALGRSGHGGSLVSLRLLASLTAALAVLQWIRPALNAAACLRIATDGLVVGASLFFVAWPTVFAPVITRGQPGVDRLIAIVPPFGDLIVLALVIVAGARLRIASRQRWSLIAGSLAFSSVADGAFAYVRLDEVLHLDAVNALAWSAGAAMLALAALAPAGGETPLAQEPRPARGFHVVLAYAPFLIAAAEGGSRLLRGTLDTGSIVIAAALMSLLFIRQVIAQFETLRLTQELDGIVREQTDELRRQEEKFRHEALHDPLTGLCNRVLFHERLEHAAALASREPKTLAVLMLDLDGFKSVNDTLGHAAGDRLLIEVASRLTVAVRPGDTVARMGGDEFAILVERADAETAEGIADRVMAMLRLPFDIEGGLRTIVPSGSLGVAVGVTNHMKAEELLQAADLAMYTAKTSGKGSYRIFESGMHEAARLRIELETDLRHAVEAGELRLHFQPIVELPSGRISGVEALVRWQHPVRGLLAPSEFIDVAEETDLIAELGSWVLNEATRHMQVWEARYGVGKFSVSVNVAARQLLTPWLVEEVASALAATGINPSSLVLEITEGALMSGSGPINDTLDALKALGVELAIDDFGTGWSSLSRLRDFPVDKLKIDRTFVREIVSPDQDVPLVTAIVAMAHSLGLAVVAEGVETLDQLACLHGLGVEEVQGYLLARPLPASELEVVLDDPAGLLDGPDEAVRSELLRSDNDGFLGLVTSAALEAPDSLSMRGMLHELQRVSGFDSVYLTAVHGDRKAQEVRVTANGGRLAIPASMVVPFPGSPCDRMLAGGPKCTADLAEAFPRFALARFGGVRGHLTVSVVAPDGSVYGTLCGASATPVAANLSLVRLFELFASLIARNLFDEDGTARDVATSGLAGFATAPPEPPALACEQHQPVASAW